MVCILHRRMNLECLPCMSNYGAVAHLRSVCALKRRSANNSMYENAETCVFNGSER